LIRLSINSIEFIDNNDIAGNYLEERKMTRLETAGWTLRKLFPGSMNRSYSAGAHNAEADRALVRLIDSPRRLPATPIERQLVAALRKAGPASVATLVKCVADDLYKEELHKGAGVLDIGLFGSRLFDRDVVQELMAADGILWQVKQEQENL
jgi:hypothetical protein